MRKPRDFKTGDLVVFDLARMTNKGVVPLMWNLSAVMVLLWVPLSRDHAQIATVLMDGVPTSVGLKHLRRVNE